MFKGVELMVLVFFKFDLEIVHLSQGKKKIWPCTFSQGYLCSMLQVLTLKGVEDTAQKKFG